MSIAITQSERAKNIINSYERQPEGKGHYGNGNHERFVGNFVDELARSTGRSRPDVASEVKDLVSRFDKYKVTGKENPIFFAKACQKTIDALSLLESLNFAIPTELSVGLVERHESNSLAFPDFAPPLIIYTSSLFDLIGDIVFFSVGPIIRAQANRSIPEFIRSEESNLLYDISIYHTLSSHHGMGGKNGKIVFISDRHCDPPILKAWAPDKTYADLFSRLLVQGRESLYQFVTLHEAAHLSHKDGHPRTSLTRTDEELFCDATAILATTTSWLRSAERRRAHPETGYLELILPLAFIRINSFIGSCKIAESEQRQISSISNNHPRGDHPGPNQRLACAEKALYATLDSLVGRAVREDVANLWTRIERQMARTLAEISPRIDSRFLKSWDDKKAKAVIRDFLDE